MWVWITTLPTPIAQGSIVRSPAARAATTTVKAKKGSTSALGCQTSNSSSLPMANCRRAVPSATAAIASTPRLRRATSTASELDATLTSMTPTASPTHGPSTRTGRASRSKYSGPGLLTSSPRGSDAEVHDPSNGLCRVPTSIARTSRIPLSPSGCHPRSSARTVATTIGVSAATSAAATAHQARCRDGVAEPVASWSLLASGTPTSVVTGR